MHGGAVTLAEQFNTSDFAPDLILTTDMLDLSTFLALTRQRTAQVPAVLYMHENQLTYPLPENGRIGPMRRQLGERDQHYAFINYASMMVANHVCFNSLYHKESFFEALRPFLKHYPEFNNLETIDLLKQNSSVLPVGISFPPKPQTISKSKKPLILWNQRWEYDKNPDLFFKTLFRLSKNGVEFKLAVCGEAFGKRPSIFTEAEERLNGQIIHFGFADRDQYEQLLWQSDIVVSTAKHEFFGISILEAIGCETIPLLPNRLSYPELLPTSTHKQILYDNDEAIYTKLKKVVTNLDTFQSLQKTVSQSVKTFDWQKIGPKYDSLFTSLSI